MDNSEKNQLIDDFVKYILNKVITLDGYDRALIKDAAEQYKGVKDGKNVY